MKCVNVLSTAWPCQECKKASRAMSRNPAPSRSKIDPVQTLWHSTAQKGLQRFRPHPTHGRAHAPPRPSSLGAGAAPQAGRPPHAPPGHAYSPPRLPQTPPPGNPHSESPLHRALIINKQTRDSSPPSREGVATVSKVPAQQLDLWMWRNPQMTSQLGKARVVSGREICEGSQKPRGSVS